jgi:hypothetical protein
MPFAVFPSGRLLQSNLSLHTLVPSHFLVKDAVYCSLMLLFLFSDDVVLIC